VPSDEFFGAIYEICEIGHLSDYYQSKRDSYQEVANKYRVIHLKDHCDLISIIIQKLVK
jgi:hypothetical protein